MAQILWDASALAERDAVEAGSAVVDVLWSALSFSQVTTTFLGYAESDSILLRKRNRIDLSTVAFGAAQSLLRDEVVHNPGFTLLEVGTQDILASIRLMERHNINSADAAILAACLRYAAAPGEVCVLVASGKRLLRAAAAERLERLGPKQMAASEAAAFAAAL